MPIGTNPEWNFPRRRCDDCGKSYKPNRPNSRYCSVKCRDAHHRHGGAYRKLRGEMLKLVGHQMQQMETDYGQRLRMLESVVRGILQKEEIARANGS